MSVFITLLLASSLCAFAAVSARYPWYIRAILIVAVVASSLAAFGLVRQHEGQPVRITDIPPLVAVFGSVIDMENGEIYMLISTGEMPARYVVTTYRRELHEALQSGEGGDGPFLLSSSDSTGGGDGQGKGRSDSISLDSAAFGVFEMPDPVMPDKR